MEQRNLPGYCLRVYVSGGGCSGIQYGMAFDNNIRTEDTVTESNGIKILVDEVSIQYLQGATVDYIDARRVPGLKSPIRMQSHLAAVAHLWHDNVVAAGLRLIIFVHK